MRKVFRFIKALWKWTLSGFKISLDHQDRLDTCLSCPHLQEDETCGVCGCFVRVKTKWKTEECPEGKW